MALTYNGLDIQWPMLERQWFIFQLDEDVRLLVQRFDADTADETGKESESSFLGSGATSQVMSHCKHNKIKTKISDFVNETHILLAIYIDCGPAHIMFNWE